MTKWKARLLTGEEFIQEYKEIAKWQAELLRQELIQARNTKKAYNIEVYA